VLTFQGCRKTKHTNISLLLKRLLKIISPSVFIIFSMLRMQEAKILMLEKELNLSEAEVAVGYSNISYFAKTFKQEFGLNPSEMIKYN
jgi:AraC family transcriptional regulator, transcriptional activator of the genes for pyochelin and ferripyochelin receptors